MRAVIHREHGGDIEVSYYCSANCVPLATMKGQPVTQDDGSALTWYLLPLDDETVEDVHCDRCGVLLWHGFEHEEEAS